MDTVGEKASQEPNMGKVESSNSPEVGFPLSQPKPKGEFNKWILIVLLLLALTGGGVYLFTRSTGQGGSPTPTPQVAGSTSTPVATATSAPVDKSKVKIEVQNGTGITGEAAYLQGQLRGLGYSQVAVGNADKQDYSDTEVTFSKSLSPEVVDEITKKLESIYKKVSVKTSGSTKSDVIIISGLRKGATARPSPTTTPKTSPTATPKTSPTGSPTSSPSPTPSPTPPTP